MNPKAEREQKLIDAIEYVGRMLWVGAVDTELGIDNAAEALAMIARSGKAIAEELSTLNANLEEHNRLLERSINGNHRKKI